jgi:NADPH:quinone reductase-like Zn-dependent oxidoreductase
MRALNLKKYGSPSDLRIEERQDPTPGAGEVLVGVVCAGVNDWDWSMVCGKPFYIRLLCGLRRPKIGVPGMEIAGRVLASGEGVDAFRVGDRVHGDLSGDGFGGFAERVAVRASALRLIPDRYSFEEAAAIPHAGLLALQGMRDVGDLKEGQSVLINGAGGGVGTIGLQLARAMGASRVVGVDHTRKLDAMKRLGFDRVIDYTTTDFTREGERFDLILDAKTTRKPTRYLRALNPGGSYVTVGGHAGKLMRALVFSFVSKVLTGKRVKILGLKPNEGLEDLDAVMQGKALELMIDGPYSFEETPGAIQRFGEALHTGKVVVRVAVTSNRSSNNL